MCDFTLPGHKITLSKIILLKMYIAISFLCTRPLIIYFVNVALFPTKFKTDCTLNILKILPGKKDVFDTIEITGLERRSFSALPSTRPAKAALL